MNEMNGTTKFSPVVEGATTPAPSFRMYTVLCRPKATTR